MAIIKDGLKAMEAMLAPAEVERAHREAEQEIFRIRLSELRERMHIRQIDVEAFSQSAISKLENRKDMKVSTLVEYLESLGLGVEIKVFPKRKRKGVPAEITLLRA